MDRRAFERAGRAVGATASGLQAQMGASHRRLAELDRAVAEDRAGAAELRHRLSALDAEIAAVEARVAANGGFLAALRTDLAPFVGRYRALCADLGALYGQSRDVHARGVEMLTRDFGYHAAYRRWSDRFTATPFTPKPL